MQYKNENTGKISTLIRNTSCSMINHNVFLYFDIIFHFSLLIWWHHRQSLKAVGVLGYPITIFMENGQALYNWLNDFDYLVAISKGQHNADTKRS